MLLPVEFAWTACACSRQRVKHHALERQASLVDPIARNSWGLGWHSISRYQFLREATNAVAGACFPSKTLTVRVSNSARSLGRTCESKNRLPQYFADCGTEGEEFLAVAALDGFWIKLAHHTHF